MLAFALRLYRLDGQGLWSDEGYTVLYAGLPIGALLAEIARIDPHPPLYYLAVKLWTAAVGGSDFALRYLSVAAGTLTVPALAVLVGRVAGRGAAVVAAALLAANPFAVWYAQEARMYALLGLLATIATLRLHLALERGSGRAWLLHAASLVLATHTHYYALALAGLHAYLAERAVRWRPDRWRALAAFLLVGLAFLPWWLSARALDYGGWMPHVTLADAARRAGWAFAVGTSIYPEQGWALAAPTLVAALLGCLALLVRRQGGALQMLAGWAVGPLLGAWLFGALTGRASFHERYVSLGAPALLALAAIGIAAGPSLAGRWLRAAGARRAGRPRGARARAALSAAAAGLAASAGLALLLGALAADARSLTWHFADPRFSKENVRAAADFIAPRAGPDDLLIGAPGRLWLYRRYGQVVMPTLETDVVWSAERAVAELSAATAGRGRIWMLPAGADVERDAERWLDERAYRLDGRWFGLAPVMSWVQADDPPDRRRAARLGPPEAPLLDAREVGFALDEAPPTRTLRVAGRWRTLGQTPPLKESIRLIDGRGRVVAQVDRPLGGEVWPLEARGPDAEATLRSALRLPPDLPAGRYAVRLVVYGPSGPLVVRPSEGPVGSEWALGDVQLAAAGAADARLVEAAHPDDRAFDGLRLVGHDLPAGPVGAGGAFTATLHWQALAPRALAPERLAEVGLGLRPLGGGDRLAGGRPDWLEWLPLGRLADAASAAARRARDFLRPAALAASAAPRWVGPEPGLAERASPERGALLRDARDLPLAREAAGPHEVVLRVGATELVLGRVEVQPAAPRPRPPPPERPLDVRFDGVGLDGLDLAGEWRAGRTATAALHWRAEREPGADLSVFVHLVSAAPGGSGAPAAQHDGPPCQGDCPTSSWAPGDELLDRHPIALPPGMAPGRYRLVVGLYDPRTGARLRRVAAEGDSAALLEIEVSG